MEFLKAKPAIFAVICQVKKGQKSSDKAEYHTNEGEGKEKLKGLRSGQRCVRLVGNISRMDAWNNVKFSPKVNVEVFLCLKIMVS